MSKPYFDLFKLGADSKRIERTAYTLAERTGGAKKMAYKALCKAFTRRWQAGIVSYPEDIVRSANKFLDAVHAQGAVMESMDMKAFTTAVTKKAMGN